MVPTATSQQIPSDFHFNAKTARIDWKRFAQIDIDRFVLEPDLDLLQSFISNLVYSNVDAEPVARTTNPHLIKFIKFSQLVIEYLLYCQDRLVNTITELENQKSHLEQEKMSMKAFFKRKIRRIQQQQEAGSKSSEHELHRCPFCAKTFLSASFLSGHLLRRHSDRVSGLLSADGAAVAEARSPSANDDLMQLQRMHDSQKLLADQLRNDISDLKRQLQQKEERMLHQQERECEIRDKHQREIEALQTVCMQEMSKMHSMSVSMAFAAKVKVSATSNFGSQLEDAPRCGPIEEQLQKLQTQCGELASLLSERLAGRPADSEGWQDAGGFDEAEIEALIKLVEQQSQKIRDQQLLLSQLLASGSFTAPPQAVYLHSPAGLQRPLFVKTDPPIHHTPPAAPLLSENASLKRTPHTVVFGEAVRPEISGGGKKETSLAAEMAMLPTPPEDVSPVTPLTGAGWSRSAAPSGEAKGAEGDASGEAERAARLPAGPVAPPRRRRAPLASDARPVGRPSQANDELADLSDIEYVSSLDDA